MAPALGGCHRRVPSVSELAFQHQKPPDLSALVSFPFPSLRFLLLRAMLRSAPLRHLRLGEQPRGKPWGGSRCPSTLQPPSPLSGGTRAALCRVPPVPALACRPRTELALFREPGSGTAGPGGSTFPRLLAPAGLFFLLFSLAFSFPFAAGLAPGAAVVGKWLPGECRVRGPGCSIGVPFLSDPHSTPLLGNPVLIPLLCSFLGLILTFSPLFSVRRELGGVSQPGWVVAPAPLRCDIQPWD